MKTIIKEAKEFIQTIKAQNGPLLPSQERTLGNYCNKINHAILNGELPDDCNEVLTQLQDIVSL